MQPLTMVHGIAAPLPLANINTDMIIPAPFIKNPTKTGLANGLFHNQRFDAAGRPIETFVLNREPYTRAVILIGGSNFGCGSSREQAPWALLDFGIRCVIAASFASIFFENCANNGLLAIRLPEPEVARLLKIVQQPEDAELRIDLPAQRLAGAQDISLRFDIDQTLKERLLKGLDSIDVTLAYEGDIANYERTQRQHRPWSSR